MPLTAFPKKNLNIPPGTPCKKFTIEISAPSLPQALLVHVSGGIFLWQSETKAAPTQRHNRPVTANPISRSNVHLLTALNRSFGWLVSKKVTDYQTEMSEAICWLIVRSQITGGAGRWQPWEGQSFHPWLTHTSILFWSLLPSPGCLHAPFRKPEPLDTSSSHVTGQSPERSPERSPIRDPFPEVGVFWGIVLEVL